METILLAAALFGLGYMLGFLQRHVQMFRLCRAQSERGDYWFDKYMMAVRDDWEPIRKDLQD